MKYTPSSTLIGSTPCHGIAGGNASRCRYWFVPSLNGTNLEDRAEDFLFLPRGQTFPP